ncbi:protein FAM200B-like [Oratosquilla oratoria]|uniref:protein FAM200B-like n=1 Tax=Oratosquilla oratoria TaxID=337810 RepID=UPI003F7691FC
MDSSSESKKRKAPAGPSRQAEASTSGSRSRRQQRYRKAWETDPAFKPWLQETPDPYKARCRLCNVTITAERTVLINHVKSKKHCSKFNGTTDNQEPVSTSLKQTAKDPVARAEIKLASVLAAHNLPFEVMDHLSEVLRDIFSDSNIAQEFAVKRTKTTEVVTNVIGKSYKEQLAHKLRETKFSVLADESTDVGSIKTSCVVVRFFDHDTGCVESKFWELCEIYNTANSENVEKGATGNLYEGMLKTFEKHEIPVTQIIGFGADERSAMMGAHNSVESRFRNECPGLFVIKCVCHSAHLCASEACKTLPKKCEDLARDVYNFFKGNSKRQSKFVQFQSFLHLKPHKMLHPSQTRWLSLVDVVQRVLEQWEALRLFFEDLRSSERLVAADTISDSLRNPFIKLYYCFLDWILPKFTNFNKYFQSDKPVITVLHEKVSALFKEIILSFMEREYVMKTELCLIDPNRKDKHLSDTEIYLGVKVLQELQVSRVTARKYELKEFFQRCREFMSVACCEIKKKYDFSDNVISKLNCLTPTNALSSNFRKSVPSLVPLVTALPLLVPPEDSSLLQRLDDQWRILPLEGDNSALNTEDIDKFWTTLSKDKPNLTDLSQFALSVLSLPHSNAECERVFSKINLFKTKARNRLKTATVNGALLATECMKSTGSCCKNFNPTNDMYSLLAAKELYSNTSHSDSE